MSRRNLSLLIATLLVSLTCYYRNCRTPSARVVAEALQEIDTWALYRASDEELMEGALRGMFGVLRRLGDDHSQYLPPRDATQQREEISGEFGGVGVGIVLAGERRAPTVKGPPEPGSPAAAGGVRAGDRIVAVDRLPTAGWDTKRLLDAIRGPVGEPVTLSLKRDGAAEVIRAQLTRAVITVPSVVGDRRLAGGEWRYRLEQDQRVALLRVRTFGDRTAEELRRLLPRLLDAGARAVVLDLRGNPGGTLDAAIDVCGMLLPAGKTVVETRNRRKELQERFTSAGGRYLDLPLVVLIDGFSASASEIVAAALQDHGRAVVIGQRSYGKGTVQRVQPLPPTGATLKLTSASFWRPSGKNIHRKPTDPESAEWGVTPDAGFFVDLPDEERKAFYEARAERDVMAAPDGQPLIDRVLQRAVEHLQAELGVASRAGTKPAA